MWIFFLLLPAISFFPLSYFFKSFCHVIGFLKMAWLYSLRGRRQWAGVGRSVDWAALFHITSEGLVGMGLFLWEIFKCQYLGSFFWVIVAPERHSLVFSWEGVSLATAFWHPNGEGALRLSQPSSCRLFSVGPSASGLPLCLVFLDQISWITPRVTPALCQAGRWPSPGYIGLGRGSSGSYRLSARLLSSVFLAHRPPGVPGTLIPEPFQCPTSG